MDSSIGMATGEAIFRSSSAAPKRKRKVVKRVLLHFEVVDTDIKGTEISDIVGYCAYKVQFSQLWGVWNKKFGRVRYTLRPVYETR